MSRLQYVNESECPGLKPQEALKSSEINVGQVIEKGHCELLEDSSPIVGVNLHLFGMM